jgi:hypothetical protein
VRAAVGPTAAEGDVDTEAEGAGGAVGEGDVVEEFGREVGKILDAF